MRPGAGGGIFDPARHPDLINFHQWGLTIPFALTFFTEGFADHFTRAGVKCPAGTPP